MSPDYPLSLDKEGYEQCSGLLAAAGMRFVQERQENFGADAVTVRGELVSPHGAFRCELHSSRHHPFFVVRVRGRGKAARFIVGDLERAFAGHLISKHEKPLP